MSKRPTTESLDAFVFSVLEHLPDSYAARRNTLVVLLDLLPRNYDRRELVALALQGLHAHENAQGRLNLPRKKTA